MRFFARLEGRQSVPPVDTAASGEAVFQLLSNRTQLFFRLNVNSISNLTVAHIHLGRRGTNGPIVAPLFSASPGISVNRGQISGTINRQDLTGPLEGRTLEDLIEAMAAGNTYVNAHTEQNPEGEIRGQIRKVD
ncbi:MAG: CHRD domain-containing protein [Clostridia bacterium]|nr:CHRD domain-containing protein [Clostridia bacterium]